MAGSAGPAKRPMRSQAGVKGNRKGRSFPVRQSLSGVRFIFDRIPVIFAFLIREASRPHCRGRQRRTTFLQSALSPADPPSILKPEY